MDTSVWTRRICTDLFGRDQRRLDAQLTELIEANQARGNPACGFMFGGEFHTFLPYRDRPAAEKKMLHADLHRAGRAYLADIKQTENEKARLTQGLTVLFQGCHAVQDIRDALPEVVVPIFPELSGLSRLREEAWTLRDKPLQQLSYAKTAELLSFYVANRILF